jgi:hypothetical protein
VERNVRESAGVMVRSRSSNATLIVCLASVDTAGARRGISSLGSLVPYGMSYCPLTHIMEPSRSYFIPWSGSWILDLGQGS